MSAIAMVLLVGARGPLDDADDNEEVSSDNNDDIDEGRWVRHGGKDRGVGRGVAFHAHLMDPASRTVCTLVGHGIFLWIWNRKSSIQLLIL